MARKIIYSKNISTPSNVIKPGRKPAVGTKEVLI
jgi:predicted transcriptional regulator